MKANDKPQVSKKWWSSEKPSDVKGAELEKALQAAEKALEEEKKKSDAKSVDTCMAALRDLGGAVDRTTKKELDKKKHKDCITVLEKYDGLIKAELKRLEEAKAKLKKTGEQDGEEGEEEEDENKLFEKDYLYKMIKVLKSSGKELRFGFGLNTQAPESSKLVLARKGSPEKLFKLLKRTGDYSNRTLTYGFAAPDPEQKKTLVFRLEESAGEPPQIIKLGRRFLRNDKSLYFRKLKIVIPGGQTFQDEDPDTEDAEGDDVLRSARTARPAPEERATRASADGGATPEDLRKQFKQARKRWVAVRQKAEQDLEIVKDGIRDHYLDDPEQFPIAMKKLKELDDIMDNLSDDLRDALDAYVSTPLKNQARLTEFGNNAKQLLENFTNYVERSPLLAAIDQKEFADVEIKAPMAAAMRDLAKTIK